MRVRDCVISIVPLLSFVAPSLAGDIVISEERLRALHLSSAQLKFLNLSQEQLKAIQPQAALPKSSSTAPTVVAKAPPPATASSASAKPDAITALLTKNERKPPSEQQYSQCPGFNLLLRQNWADTGIIAGSQCPDTVDKATGAQLSFTDDRVKNNRTAIINGTAALIYNSVTGDTPGQITPYEISYGVYTTVDQSWNSALAQAKLNIDTFSYGGVLELGYSNNEGGNYFRIRGASVEDGIKNTTAGNAAIEWLPVYNPLSIHVPVIQPFGLPLITRFDPALVALFDETVGKNQILAFNNRRESLRLGPELALNFLPFPGGADFLSHFNAKVAYDWFYETYSGASLNWFTGSVTYNIDQAGHIGLTGTYKRGQDLNTGEMANVYTLGLSGKI